MSCKQQTQTTASSIMESTPYVLVRRLSTSPCKTAKENGTITEESILRLISTADAPWTTALCNPVTHRAYLNLSVNSLYLLVRELTSRPCKKPQKITGPKLRSRYNAIFLSPMPGGPLHYSTRLKIKVILLELIPPHIISIVNVSLPLQ